VHISFAVFADAANVSQEGKLNLLGIFDAVHVGSFPTVHPRTHLVIRLKGSGNDVGEHMLAFSWVNPSGKELWKSEGDMQVQAAPDAPVASLDTDMDLPVIAVVDLPLDMTGHYAMQISLDGQQVASIPLFVNGPSFASPARGSGPKLVS
jgi:hypothetical protein